ncbi:MAG: AhpD family alkylhydroperoxidase [Acidimicrobiales bacterium]|jgi:AhpD family alkylhydroperoxidase
MTETIDNAGVQHTDFVARHHELQRGFKELYRAVPGAMSGFTAMHQAGVADGALSRGMKELIALAVGICGHCDGCIAFHIHDALEAGATREEIEETIGVAILMGGGPAAVYGADALVALRQFENDRT